jgi:hypothetical protein
LCRAATFAAHILGHATRDAAVKICKRHRLNRSVICRAGEWRAASRCIGKSFTTSASAASASAASSAATWRVARVVFMLLTNGWSVKVARLKVIK